MAKNSAQAPTEKPEAQKGSAAKMPLFPTKFDGSGSDNTDEFRRTLSGHLERVLLRLFGRRFGRCCLLRLVAALAILAIERVGIQEQEEGAQ